MRYDMRIGVGIEYRDRWNTESCCQSRNRVLPELLQCDYERSLLPFPLVLRAVSFHENDDKSIINMKSKT